MNKKIVQNMPLPSNTKYKWIECFAKLILEKKVPSEFFELEIIDQPDLQNFKTSIGIEVTSAVDASSQELERLYSELEHEMARNVEKVKKKIEKLGGKVSNGILIHPVKNRTLENIYRSYKNKLLLLNGKNYRIFKHNYIFVTDENVIHELELNIILEKLIKIQSKYNYNFDRVYIYLYGDNLYEFDLNNRRHAIYSFLEGEINNISCEARKMVEEKENEIKLKY